MKNGATVRVGDLGTVAPGAPDRTLLVTGNGRDAVVMSISQQIGANIIDLKAGMDNVLASLAKTLPSGIMMNRVYDLAQFVEESITSVRDAILIGGFLAIIVLIVFLRDWRLTMIAAVTLPMAVIPTFVFMWLFGGTINLMSMGGLAVAIGLVIDDAVVVVENIHRRAGEGGSSVIDAVQQLMAPLVSSTLTTVVVFAPLGLLSGVPGQFFRALSLSLSVAVLISLALSISVVPLMAKWASSHHRPAGETHGRVEQFYERTLGVMIARPLLSVVVALLLAAVTVVLFYQVGTGFFPAADEGGFVVDYLTPAGSALAETDRQVRKIEQIVGETPEVAAYSRRTGSELGLFATAQNTGDVLVRLKPRGQRSRSADEIISEMRDKSPRGRAARRGRVRPAPAGHARRPRRESRADRDQDLRRRSRSSRGAGRTRRGDDGQGPGHRRRRRRADGEPRSDLDGRSRGGGTLRSHGGDGLGPARRQLARRGGDRSAARRSHDSRPRPSAGLIPVRSRASFRRRCSERRTASRFPSPKWPR